MAQPVAGELYKHFKGGLYRIVTIAQHTETEEGLVIYRSEDDPSKVWARPVVNFLSPVDRVKYPDATQEMRFEKVFEVTVVFDMVVHDEAVDSLYSTTYPVAFAIAFHLILIEADVVESVVIVGALSCGTGTGPGPGVLIALIAL